MITLDHAAWILLLALLLDALIGDPDWLWRRCPHPVVWFGTSISYFDRRWNDPPRNGVSGRYLGSLTLVILMLVAIFVGGLVQWTLQMLPYGELALAVIAAVFIAQKSLFDHVKEVERSLELQGLPEARQSVSMIVGRDTKTLDESGVTRASIESLAENFSDGVIAPAFWFLVLGLPGLFAYKMLNTADSMIGHRSEKYRNFGWASARSDDLANWIPARMSAWLVVVAAYVSRNSALKSLSTVRQDAHLHRSPNAGWPEAAFAGALDIALSGPRIYDTGPTEDPFVNASGRRRLMAQDIREALKLYVVTCLVFGALVMALALMT